jgi:hypothetical protein
LSNPALFQALFLCDNRSNQEANVTQEPHTFRRKHPWIKWVAGGLVLVLVITAAVVDLALHRAEPFLRAHIVSFLEDRFHARVELDSFHVSLVNGMWAEGKGLRIWPPAQVGGVAVPQGQGEPLMRLDEFRFHAPLYYRPSQPIHVSTIQLKGLDIHMPPKSHLGHTAVAFGNPRPASGLLSFRVDTIECTAAKLVMETSKPGKLPMIFAIAHLHLTNIATGGAMSFDAELTNPRPVGTIHTKGSFGPWQMADPGESPLSGDYTFDHADLAAFRGIAGTLDSTGHYQGTLRNLTVDGHANVPNFQLTHFDSPIPLMTRFHAYVDGTNGDTHLDPVEAILGHAHFSVQGQIVRILASDPGTPPHSIGHDIALTVNMNRAPIEDFMQLVSRSKTPLLTGAVTAKTSLHIQPGPAQIHERIKLNGQFQLDQARFSSDKIQSRIEELSLRGQGRPKDVKNTDANSVLSQMQGNFQLAGGVLTLPALTYTVPGATILLKGAYTIDGGALNFAGVAKMDAPVSKIVGGWKGFLLKPADRFFQKNGSGTEVPIHIEGTREAPKFGIDFDRLKSHSSEN